MTAPAMTAERALDVLDQAAATLEWHERYRDVENVQKARAFFAAMVERELAASPKESHADHMQRICDTEALNYAVAVLADMHGDAVTAESVRKVAERIGAPINPEPQS